MKKFDHHATPSLPIHRDLGKGGNVKSPFDKGDLGGSAFYTLV